VSEVKELSQKRVNLKMTITPITSILRHLYAPINFTVKQETAAAEKDARQQLNNKREDQTKKCSRCRRCCFRSLLLQQVKPIERPTTNSAANQYENACSERANE